MSQDLLSAIGARLEARLKTQDARANGVSDALAAKGATGPRAPFTLLDDPTRYEAASSAESPVPPTAVAEAVEMKATIEPRVDENFPQHIDLVAKAQVMANAVPPAAVVETIASAAPTPVVETAITAPAPAAATVAATVAAVDVVAGTVAPATAIAAAVVTPPIATPVATPAAVMIYGANTGASSASSASSSASTGRPAAATTPPVPASFGVGATFRRAGVMADPLMTVNRIGDGVVFATYTDSEGTREVAFHPDQLDLVTAAP